MHTSMHHLSMHLYDSSMSLDGSQHPIDGHHSAQRVFGDRHHLLQLYIEEEHPLTIKAPSSIFYHRCSSSISRCRHNILTLCLLDGTYSTYSHRDGLPPLFLWKPGPRRLTLAGSGPVGWKRSGWDCADCPSERTLGWRSQT